MTATNHMMMRPMLIGLYPQRVNVVIHILWPTLFLTFSLVHVDLADASVPKAPTELFVWPDPGNIIKLSWNSSQGANGYVVYRNSSIFPASGFVPITASPITKTNYTDEGRNLVEGIKYEYRVTAVNSSGTSQPSEIKSAIPYRPITSTNIVIASLSSIILVTAIILSSYWIVRYTRRRGIKEARDNKLLLSGIEYTKVLQKPILTADALEQDEKEKEAVTVSTKIDNELRLWKFWNIIRGDDWYPSLSLFQFFLWTVVILFSFIFLTIIRIDHHLLPSLSAFVSTPTIPSTLLVLMGISVTTPIVSTALSSNKYSIGSSFDPPDRLPGLGTMLQEGCKPSLTRFQMFAWTLISIAIFFGSTYVTIADNLDNVTNLSLPNVDPTLLVLMGISQIAYIGGKAVSRNPGVTSIYPRVIAVKDLKRIDRSQLISIFGSGFGIDNQVQIKGQVWLGNEYFEWPVPDQTSKRKIISWEDDKIDLKISDFPPGSYYVRVASPGALYKAKEPLEVRADISLSMVNAKDNTNIHTYPSVNRNVQ